MTPNLFESLVFLKVNNEYWDCNNVQEAYTRAKKEAQSDRINKMLEEDNNFGGDVEFEVDANA